MTGKELLRIALSHLGETEEESSEYPYAVDEINVILSELFDTQNRKRIYAGGEKLEKPQKIENLSEVLFYDERVLTECASYGLAAKLVLEEENFAKFNYYNSMYINAAVSYTQALRREIIDLYGDDLC